MLFFLFPRQRRLGGFLHKSLWLKPKTAFKSGASFLGQTEWSIVS
jgi:hypothetical protein